MTLWELRSKVEEIVDLNIKEGAYESIEINKKQLVSDIIEFISRIHLNTIEKLRNIINQ